MPTQSYGLELTNNSKVGYAFSISRQKTCINATTTCKQLCYGNGIRYKSAAQTQKRERNYLTAQFLLREGGPKLLAENLIHLIDTTRPRDWLTAKITQTLPAVPWTLRIHDVGDFYSIDYASAWTITAQQRPECKFWFYTRSFLQPNLLSSITELASQPNCQGWLSADQDNYRAAIAAYRCNPEIWKLALLQNRDLPPHVAAEIKKQIPTQALINFPYHHGGYHVQPLKSIKTCPAVLGTYKLSTNANTLRPCQHCTYCLPA